MAFTASGGVSVTKFSPITNSSGYTVSYIPSQTRIQDSGLYSTITVPGSLVLKDPVGGYGTTISASTVAASNLSIVLPPDAGALSNVLSTDGNGVLSWVAPDSGPTGPTGPTGDTGVTGATGPIAGTNGQIIFNNSGAAGATSNMTYSTTTAVTTFSGVTVANGLTVTNGPLTLPTSYKQKTIMYVSGNGNDTTGIGSILRPYATLQKAVDVLETTTGPDVLSQSNQAVIYLGPNYSNVSLGINNTDYGPCTITKGFLTINGYQANYNQAQYAVNVGAITLNISSSGSTSQNVVMLNSLFINGGNSPAITNTSTTQHSLVIKNSYLLSSGTEQVVNQTPYVASDLPKFTMEDCYVAQNGSSTSVPLMLLSGNTEIVLNRLEVEGTNFGPLVNIGGNSWLRGCVGSLLQCTLSSSSNTPPIVEINSGTVGLPHTFASNTFLYPSVGSDKRTQPTAHGIAFTNTTLTNLTAYNAAVIQIFNNIFQLGGTSNPSNYIVKTYNPSNTLTPLSSIFNTLYVYRSGNKAYPDDVINKYTNIIDPSLTASVGVVVDLLGVGPNDPTTVSNWSYYSAVSNVNLNGNAISNIGTVNGVYLKDGAAGTSLGIGISAGATSQGSNVVAIGTRAGLSGQQSNSIAIGNTAGFSNLCSNSIAIGVSAAALQVVGNTQPNRIAIGTNAGTSNQATSAIAIGVNSANASQGANSIAIGSNAGLSNLCSNSIAIGVSASALQVPGNTQPNRIAIGTQAGYSNQLSGAIAIGSNAGNVSQGIQAVAIGWGAGATNQGNNAIAIGTNAGATNQPSNSIVINASGSTTLNATFSGAFYVAPVRSNTNIASYSLLAYSTSSEIFAVSAAPPAASFGNILRVDASYGSDTLGAVGTYPYATISKALSVATAGQLVQIMPGTYTQTADLTVPASVAIRGAGTQSVVIQRLDATTSATLFTLGSNCRIEDVTLTLTSSSTVTADAVYTAVRVDGSNIPSSKLRTMVINVTNNNPSGSCAGLLSTGTVANSSIATSADTIRGSTINVTTSGQQNGYASCVRVDGQNRLSARDTNLFVTGTNCSGSRVIGCETTVSYAYLDLRSSLVSASGSSMTNCVVSEISQTNPSSEIILSYSRLQNLTANSRGFTTAQVPTNIVFGFYKDKGAGFTPNGSNDNNTYFLLPGTTPLSTSILDISNAAPFVIEQDCLMRGIFFNANSTISSGTVKAMIYHNDLNTLTASLELNSLTGKVVSNGGFSYKFHQGDSMFVTISMALSDTSINPNLRSFQINVGLF